jgi:phosphoribosyl 1,2-cyclic phosphodiesterase
VRFASLGSGSRGNGSVVASDSTTVLVDCGFSYKEAISRLKRLKVDPDSLSGILVTHEHSDHASGIEGLANRHNIPVYASRGTWIEIGQDICNKSNIINGLFSIGDIEVRPIAVPHDAREPLQFVFIYEGRRLGILSDLGSISGRVLQGFQELDALSVEFNHDRELLQNGPYPSFLKSRVGGDFGHLNNDQAASLVAEIVSDRLRTVVACHISETNNEVSRVEEALEKALKGRNIERLVASQSNGFNWITVGT